MAIFGVSILQWIFILWILTFLLADIARIFTGRIPEGIFWGVFLLFCGVMILIHYVFPVEYYLGSSIGSISIIVYIGLLLVLYGIRFLLKGWLGALLNVVLILGFGYWVFVLFPYTGV